MSTTTTTLASLTSSLNPNNALPYRPDMRQVSVNPQLMELLRLHIAQAQAMGNGTICRIYDYLRGTATGDSRTGRKILSLGNDGLPYWVGMGSSKVFRQLCESHNLLSFAHSTHAVHPNVVDKEGNAILTPSGRTWHQSTFTRTRSRVVDAMPDASSLSAPTWDGIDPDGMDAPVQAPTVTPRKRTRKTNK